MARQFNNIMDMLQLVFVFVNAPLFATFLLGMFWRRTTGHGAFFGLILAATGLFGGAALVEQSPGIKMNLWWGVAQLVFGASMLGSAVPGKKT